jgi:hypothetical protein
MQTSKNGTALAENFSSPVSKQQKGAEEMNKVGTVFTMLDLLKIGGSIPESQ